MRGNLWLKLDILKFFIRLQFWGFRYFLAINNHRCENLCNFNNKDSRLYFLS